MPGIIIDVDCGTGDAIEVVIAPGEGPPGPEADLLPQVMLLMGV